MLRPRIPLCLLRHVRLQSSLNVAVIGSGPSGFYTAHDLLKRPEVKVTLFEKLPTPFGLSRYGVAPDHPEVKNCEETFSESARNDRFQFVGNCEVGKDVTLTELQRRFNGVVFAYGCENGNHLHIPGEDSAGVINAHEFVAWYNGNPSISWVPPPLDQVEDVVIVGNGNVAMDIARLLLMPVDELEVTDMTKHSVDVLKKSTVKRVRIVARRGFLESAFTTKEIRELCQLEKHGVEFIGVDDAVLEVLKPIKNKLERVQKRKLETVMEFMKPSGERKGKLKYTIPEKFDKQWKLEYLLSPVEIESNAQDARLCSKIVFQRNQLVQDSPESRVRVKPIAGSLLNFKADLVIPSLGFHGSPMKGLESVGITFDSKRGIIPNADSRVLSSDNEVVPGFYTVGWIKNAKKGPILNTLVDSNTVCGAIMKDFEDGNIKRETMGMDGLDLPNAVGWDAWLKLNEFELAYGECRGKSRWKVEDVETMLDIINDPSPVESLVTKYTF